MNQSLDNTDKAILNLLQDDATLPLKTVAEHVNVSVAASHTSADREWHYYETSRYR